MAFGEPQQRLRHADAIVQVPFRLQHRPPLGQHAGHHLLGGRLAVAAGDRHERDVEAAAMTGGELLEGDQGVRHAQNDGSAAGNLGAR